MMAITTLVPQSPAVRDITFYSGRAPLQVCEYRLNQVSQDVHSVAVNARFQKVLREKIHATSDKVSPVFFVLEEERVVVIDRDDLENGPTEIGIEEFDRDIQDSIHAVLRKANQVWSGCRPCNTEVEVKTLRERVQLLEGQLESRSESFEREKLELQQHAERQRLQLLQMHTTILEQGVRLQQFSVIIEQQKAVIQRQVTELQQAKAHFQSQIQELQVQHNAELEGKDSVIQQLQQELQKLKAAALVDKETIERLTQELTQLQQEHDELKSLHARQIEELTQKHASNLETKEARIRELESELQETKRLLETTTEELVNLKKAHATELAVKNQEIQDLTEKLSLVQLELENVRAQLARALEMNQSNSQEIQASAAEKDAQISQLQKQLRESEQEKALLTTTHKEEIEALTATFTARMERLTFERDLLKEYRDRAERRIQDLLTMNAEASSRNAEEIKSLRNEYYEVRNLIIMRHRQKMQMLRTDYEATLEHQKEEYAKLQKRNSASNRVVQAEHVKEVEQLQQQFNQRLRDLEEKHRLEKQGLEIIYKQQITSLIEQHAQITIELEKQRRLVLQLQSNQNAELESTKLLLKQAMIRIEELEAEIERLNALLAQSSPTLSPSTSPSTTPHSPVLSVELTEEQRELRETERRLEEIGQEIAQHRTSLQRLETTEKRIVAINTELSQKGLKPTKRTELTKELDQLFSKKKDPSVKNTLVSRIAELREEMEPLLKRQKILRAQAQYKTK
ncbi:MAG: hypothetical protein HKM07_04605 [Chlamydiae bacterium]|nr:hypothetical protein [Chlamydiota bacterium]